MNRRNYFYIHGKGINIKFLKRGLHLLHPLQAIKRTHMTSGSGVRALYDEIKPIETSMKTMSLKKSLKPLRFKY